MLGSSRVASLSLEAVKDGRSFSSVLLFFFFCPFLLYFSLCFVVKVEFIIIVSLSVSACSLGLTI